MDVVSTSPLRVASMVWQPRTGAWALTVVCKATFQLTPGVSPLAELQEAPADEVHWDDDEARSLHRSSDLVPFKARADVLLVGHAFAPGGQAARSLPVRLVVGTVDKRLEVWCDRIFWQDGQVLEGQPFTRMPLRYERAAGGPGTANPVGMRFDAPPDAYGAVPVPNLQPPGLHVTRRGDAFGPVAFGPIAPGWPERAGKLGSHAAGWSHRRWRDRPLPGDLDRAYFNSAPPDQQVATIEPDERIVLENLHPEHPILETRLPGLQPRALFTGGGRAGEGVALKADTLSIDTDRSQVMVVWRGRVPLSHAAEAGTLVVLLGGEPEGTVALGGEGFGGATLNLGPGGAPLGAVMPFAQASSSGEVGTLPGGREGGPVLPFGPAKSPWVVFKPGREASREPAPADTGTVYGVKGKAHGVLPRTWATPSPTKIAPIAEVEIDDEETPVAAEPVETPEPAVTVETNPEERPAEIPLERCAAIAASIARRRGETSQILAEDALDPAAWAALGRRWDQAIYDEVTLGKTELLERYDRAYVARLEAERGPILVEEYARLMRASERGNLADVLEELTLPRGAMVRVTRLWLRKIAADPDLGQRVKRALSAP